MILREISKKDIETIGRLLLTGKGEEVLEILSKSFYNTISHTPGDTHTTAFKEGHRDLVGILRNAVELVKQQDKETNDG